MCSCCAVSTHSRPKAAGLTAFGRIGAKNVSTHSRPKAAGCSGSFAAAMQLCFNTQPPEGGWKQDRTRRKAQTSFNTQPPEGGWPILKRPKSSDCRVSTHSRPKAAGQLEFLYLAFLNGFNTQPPEGGWNIAKISERSFCGFNTQPPEGGWVSKTAKTFTSSWFQHTAARRRLDDQRRPCQLQALFQHTAARRRLAIKPIKPSKVT